MGRWGGGGGGGAPEANAGSLTAQLLGVAGYAVL